MQSEASQIVSRMLAPAPGATVVDCAAAPGGKATHLAELVGGGRKGDRARPEFRRAPKCARDGAAPRASKYRRRACRCGPSDSASVREFRLCAARRALHRNRHAPAASGDSMAPEARRPAPDGRACSYGCSRNAAALLRPGGAMVYSVCSLMREEGREVVASSSANIRATSSIRIRPVTIRLRDLLAQRRHAADASRSFGARRILRGADRPARH